MINIKDSLILDDDNEYVVVSKIKYDNKEFYYILDKFNNDNFKICYQDNDELIEIGDEILIKKLLPLFFEIVKKEVIDVML